MNDIERGPGREAPPDGERHAREGAERSPAPPEERAEAAERNARAEVAAERREAKERIADVLWERPKRFVERVIEQRLAPSLRRFLAKFGSLGDEAMASDELKRTRDAARREAGTPEKD